MKYFVLLYEMPTLAYWLKLLLGAACILYLLIVCKMYGTFKIIHWTSLLPWLMRRGEIYVSYIFPIAAQQILGQSPRHVLKLR